MEDPYRKWNRILSDLGHPCAWDEKTFLRTFLRDSKDRQKLLNWMAPKILELCRQKKKYPLEIDLPAVLAQFICIRKEELSGFINGSLLQEKQKEIWNSIFWKIEFLSDKDGNRKMLWMRSAEDQSLIDRAQQASKRADAVLNKPLPQLLVENSPLPSREPEVSCDEELEKLKKFCKEVNRVSYRGSGADISVDLTQLKILSEMAEAMKTL